MLVDGGSRVASLVHEHRAGAFEAELFDQPTDYAPAALAIATAEQVLVFDEEVIARRSAVLAHPVRDSHDRLGTGILGAVASERSVLMAEEPPAGAGVTTWLVDEQVWEYDEETGGQVAMLLDSPTVQAGLWRPGRSGLGPIEVDLDHTEIILVLSGKGQLEVDDASPLKLTPGRAVRIGAGARTRWVVDQEFCELWLYV